jgi:hypothetical protein
LSSAVYEEEKKTAKKNIREKYNRGMYRNENYFPRMEWNMLNMMSHTLGVHFAFYVF